MNIIEEAYRHLAKPLFFRLDPEAVHDTVTRLGQFLGSMPGGRNLTRRLLCAENARLEQTLHGIHFPNPVGLAAGFDKDARLTDILPDVGFGFAELGSITGKPCAGNDGTRLWRLPESEALVVYYGLKNDGADAISTRLRGKEFRIPMGISAAKTNSRSTVDPEAAIADYIHVVEQFRGIGDYLTINISCPNAFGGEPFTDPALLDRLLSAVDAAADKPVFVKLAVDLEPAQIEGILEVVDGHRVAGLVCSNLTKNRDNHRIVESVVPSRGGISGKAMQHLSDKQIRHIYERTHGRYTLIGVGGIFSAEDVYQKIKNGASLVQLITGMVYRGPQLIGQINRGLIRLMDRDGITNISDAVGKDCKAA
jgi:dihydroorotate dehydrogenase